MYKVRTRLVNFRVTDEEFEKLKSACDRHGNVEQVLQSPSSYTVNRTGYLLGELPHLQVGRHIEGVLRHMLDTGLTPIVAHPERNPVLQSTPQMLEAWVASGCLVQLTAQSITGGFGSQAKRMSAWILDRGIAHLVASDCHDPVHRHPRLDQAYTAVHSRHGTDYAEVLFRENPRDILAGVRLPGGRQTLERSSASWWQFWRRSTG